MFKVDIKHNLDQFRRDFEREFEKRKQSIMRDTVNNIAARVVAAMPDAMDKQLDRPNAFTKRGVFIKKYASKTDPTAIVAIRPKQAEYLQYQIAGGVRSPTKKGLKLPGAINLDAFGNIPRGAIKQLLAVAKRESKLGKRTARKIKVSSSVEIFYGDPTDVGVRNSPPGIYKRVAQGTRHRLIPLIVFPAVDAHYRPRFDFLGTAKRVIDRELGAAFADAVAINKNRV